MPRRPRDDPRAEHLDRATIVRTALALIDRDGCRRFSVRALARELDVGNMSVYWHIADRQTLIGLVLDEVIGGIELPAPGEDPLEALHDLCRAFVAAFREHPETSELFATMPITGIGPRSVALFDHAIGLLRAAGVPPDRIPGVTTALFEYLAGHLVGGAADSGPGTAREVDELLDRLAEDEAPNLRALRDEITGGWSGSVDDGLHLILGGLDPTRPD